MQESYYLVIFIFIIWLLYRVASELLYLLNQLVSYIVGRWNIDIELKAKELNKDEEEDYQVTSCIGFQVDSTTDDYMPDEE